MVNNQTTIGGMPETQEVVYYCADKKILPRIQIIKAEEINDAWKKVANKQAHYRDVNRRFNYLMIIKRN